MVEKNSCEVGEFSRPSKQGLHHFFLERWPFLIQQEFGHQVHLRRWGRWGVGREGTEGEREGKEREGRREKWCGEVKDHREIRKREPMQDTPGDLCFL